MCGICGLLGRDAPDPGLVERMNGAIVHRGPDHGAVEAHGRCVLGYRRLSIIDLATGDQPVRNETGEIVAVFNGELYNFRELRRELEALGHEIRGTGDSPLVPHAYEEWGLGVAENGSLRTERYWSVRTRPVAATVKEVSRDWIESVHDEVTAAVRRRLVADVPLGALLSGGIDSSIVVAAMAQASAEPVRTFTVGFSDERYDERTYARAVAQRYATVHEELELVENVAATLPRLAAAYDEPLGD